MWNLYKRFECIQLQVSIIVFVYLLLLLLVLGMKSSAVYQGGKKDVKYRRVRQTGTREDQLEPIKTSFDDRGDMLEKLMPSSCRKWRRSGRSWRSHGPGCYPRPTRWAGAPAAICMNYNSAGSALPFRTSKHLATASVLLSRSHTKCLLWPMMI